MENSGGGIAGVIMMLVWLAVIIAVLAGFWKVFVKAGKPGWACLIPIYNIVVLLQIVGRPIWWIILLIIPIVSIVVAIIVSIDMAKSFGETQHGQITAARGFDEDIEYAGKLDLSTAVPVAVEYGRGWARLTAL